MVVSKHNRRRKFRRYLAGQLDINMPLVTLASKNLLGKNAAGTLTEKAFLSSVKAFWSLTDFTAAAGDGPVEVGLCHSDYSDSEVEEWIENSGSWASENQRQQEITRRKIRRVGVFRGANTDATGIAVLNDGKLLTTKCGWLLQTGQTVRIWAYNQGSGALTTGSIVLVNGHANLWPN